MFCQNLSCPKKCYCKNFYNLQCTGYRNEEKTDNFIFQFKAITFLRSEFKYKLKTKTILTKENLQTTYLKISNSILEKNSSFINLLYKIKNLKIFILNNTSTENLNKFSLNFDLPKTLQTLKIIHCFMDDIEIDKLKNLRDRKSVV